MNKQIVNILFFLIVSTLIFNNVPKPIQMNFLGGPVGDKLVFYPLLIGFIYTAYCQWKYKNVLINFKPFAKYLCIYISLVLFSLILGFLNYPYWNDVLTAPVNQIEKLPMVLGFFLSHGIEIDVKILTSLWIIARQLKGIFLEAFWCFGGAYMFYCWYKDDWQQGFKVLFCSSIFAISIIFIYSSIEILYLAGNKGAESILSTVTPYFHSIKNDGKWWPPLLWKGQLRSVFAEPSYFGIYTAFVMPLLWYKVIKTGKWFYYAVIIVMTFLLFLTKARTGFMLYLGEVFLLAVFTLCFLRYKWYMQRIAILFLCSMITFIGSNLFITNFIDKPIKVKNVSAANFATTVSVKDKGLTQKKEKADNNKVSVSITKYVDDNALSLANPNRRSNRARYSVMEADLKIGLAHPLLGIGMGLRSAYIPDYFSQAALQNTEVKMWMAFQKKLGILRSGFPKLGEYTSRFAETGILGLLIFIFPPSFLIYKLFKKIRKCDVSNGIEYISLMIALLGIMVSGIGDILNVNYCYWILLGLGYAMVLGKDGLGKSVNERA